MSNRDFQSVDLQVLAAIVRDDSECLTRAFADSDFDANRFALFAFHHQVAGFLHTALKSLPEATPLSPIAEARFSGAYLQQWLMNERIGQGLRRVSAALDAAECPFVLLKGLTIACKYYGGAERRAIADLDLLVRKHDLDHAMGVLEECDYARASGALFGLRIASLFVHAFDFQGGAVPIDLHWVLANHPSYRIDYDALWETSRPIELEGARVRVLDDEHTLAFSLIGIAKDLGLGTLRLKAFVDLYKIAASFDRAGSWPAFFEDRKKERTARTARGILGLLINLFETKEQLPALDEFLDRSERPRLPGGLVARLTNAKISTRDRLWATRLYETSAARAWSWWALSLPFRIGAHRYRRAREATKA